MGQLAGTNKWIQSILFRGIDIIDEAALAQYMGDNLVRVNWTNPTGFMIRVLNTQIVNCSKLPLDQSKSLHQIVTKISFYSIKNKIIASRTKLLINHLGPLLSPKFKQTYCCNNPDNCAIKLDRLPAEHLCLFYAIQQKFQFTSSSQLPKSQVPKSEGSQSTDVHDAAQDAASVYFA